MTPQSKLRVSVFLLNEPKVKFSMGYFHHALWLLRSSSSARSSCAVSIHSALTPVRPWLCSAASHPDKLLCLQAAPSSAPNISSYFYPIPPTDEVSACPLITVWWQLSTCGGRWMGSHEGHSCWIITWEDWVQVYITAKTTTSSPLGKMWRWHLSISNIGSFCSMFGELGKCWKNKHQLLLVSWWADMAAPHSSLGWPPGVFFGRGELELYLIRKGKPEQSPWKPNWLDCLFFIPLLPSLHTSS